VDQVNRYTGMYIHIEDIKEFEDNVSKQAAEEKDEVVINIHGLEKKFTVKEFAEKLGF